MSHKKTSKHLYFFSFLFFSMSKYLIISSLIAEEETRFISSLNPSHSIQTYSNGWGEEIYQDYLYEVDSMTEHTPPEGVDKIEKILTKAQTIFYRDLNILAEIYSFPEIKFLKDELMSVLLLKDSSWGNFALKNKMEVRKTTCFIMQTQEGQRFFHTLFNAVKKAKNFIESWKNDIETYKIRHLQNKSLLEIKNETEAELSQRKEQLKMINDLIEELIQKGYNPTYLSNFESPYNLESLYTFAEEDGQRLTKKLELLSAYLPSQLRNDQDKMNLIQMIEKEVEENSSVYMDNFIRNNYLEYFPDALEANKQFFLSDSSYSA
jgi:hypothetical protein